MNQTSQDENYSNDQLEDNYCLDVPRNRQNSDVSKGNEGQSRRTESGEIWSLLNYIFILIYKAMKTLNSSLPLATTDNNNQRETM